MTRRMRMRLIKMTLRATLVVGAALAPMPSVPPALAQSVDEQSGELVPQIQRSVEDIQLELRVDPARAAESLAHQKERLEELRREAPDHPMLSSLERRLDELGEEIAAAREAQPAAEEQFVPLSVPADVRLQLRDVEQLQTQSDREMMRGRLGMASGHLDEAAALIDTIEQDYGDRIPPAYAPLIVAKERLSALKDQLDRHQEP